MNTSNETNEKIIFSIACFCGALLGAILSLWIFDSDSGFRHFWIVGALLGGCTSYGIKVYDKIIPACKQAWNDVVNWKPDLKKLKSFIYSGLIFGIIEISLLIYLILPSFVLDYSNTENPTFVGFILSIKNFLEYGLTITFLSTFVIGGIIHLDNDRKIEESFFKIINPFLPITLIIFIIYHYKKWLFPIGRVIKFIIVTIAKFVFRVFVLINSDMALLCLVSGTSGAAIGFYHGSPLIGGVYGLIIGNACREIAKRILKVIPLKINGN